MAGGERFPRALMHAAATLYYLEDATQADIAERLGTSRATVSRLLSAARRERIVRIEVVDPVDQDLEQLARGAEAALGLEAVHLSPLPANGSTGEALAPALSVALGAVGLVPGDVLLVSSGRTVFEAAQAELPALPRVQLAPMIGGQDEPEVWYAPNEITRQFAAKVGGSPTFLYAPRAAWPRAVRDAARGPLSAPGLRAVAHGALRGRRRRRPAAHARLAAPLRAGGRRLAGRRRRRRVLALLRRRGAPGAVPRRGAAAPRASRSCSASRRRSPWRRA